MIRACRQAAATGLRRTGAGAVLTTLLLALGGRSARLAQNGGSRAMPVTPSPSIRRDIKEGVIECANSSAHVLIAPLALPIPPALIGKVRAGRCFPVNSCRAMRSKSRVSSNAGARSRSSSPRRG